MPAPSADVNLCKTLLTGSVLGYPVPTLVAYEQTFNKSKSKLGKRRELRLTSVLQQTLWMAVATWPRSPAFSSGSMGYPCQPTTISSWSWTHTVRQLALIQFNSSRKLTLETDIWFQLRVEVLLQRYHSLNAQANERMKEQLGRAVEKENLKQTVIFGASKRYGISLRWCGTRSTRTLANRLEGVPQTSLILSPATRFRNRPSPWTSTVSTPTVSWAATAIPATASATSTRAT